MAENPLDLLKMLTGDSALIRHNYHVYATESQTSISIAGSIDVTLTEAEAAHYQIEVTGAITGDIVVFLPQKEKPYLFINATTGAFAVTVQPVTSGTGVLLARGMRLPLYCDGTNVIRDGVGLAVTPEATFHTIERDGIQNTNYMDQYLNSETGVRINGRHARGTQASPVRLNTEDRTLTLQGQGWGRNANNTADGWVTLGILRVGVVDSKDAEGRLGGNVEIHVAPGGSAAEIARFRFSQDGSLILGNPVTGSDKVSLAAGNRDGVAGKYSLTITAEDGTEHLFGDIARLTRLSNEQSLDIGTLTEITTIAAAAFTDTTMQIPADTTVKAVSVRVLSTIPTAVSFSYGILGSPTRYGTDISTAASTISSGALDGSRYYPTATKIRFTPKVTPATNAGTIRTTIHYERIVPPVS